MKKTIKEEYAEILEKNDIDEIVHFIAQQNAKLILAGTKPNIPAKLKKEVIEFVNFFEKTCTDNISQALWENYRRIPFIFNVADQFMWEDMIDAEKRYLFTLNYSRKRVAESLSKKLWSIRKDRILSFYIDEEEMKIEIPHIVPKHMLNDFETHLLYWCVKLINSHAAGLCVRTIDKNRRVEIFGIKAANGKWEPITSNEMIDAHTLMPDGTRIEPEKDVIYTDIRDIA